MASKWRGGRDPHVEPDGKVRQSQASSTFGPGAMIDLVHDAVVVGGLDFWRYDKSRSVSEPRLRDAIASRLEESGRKLCDEGSFRLPPTGDDHEPRRNCGIEVLEFPKWFICQNPDCRHWCKATRWCARATSTSIRAMERRATPACRCDS